MNNVEINIVEIAKSTYQAHLLNTNAHNEFNFIFDFAEKQELQNIMKRISRGETDADFAAQLKKYGNNLYNRIFNGEFGVEFKKLGKESFCLHLHLPPALEILPWEYLADEEDFLFKGMNSLIRVPSEKKKVSLQRIALPVRILVVISNPPDLPENMKLDVAREKRLIKDALRPLIDEGKLAVKWEDEASLERIQNALINFKPHVIHYTGHGDFDGEKGILLLEDGKDRSMPVSGTLLAERLAGRDVRLIVLSGCQTAITKYTDPFSSVAGALVKKGVPSVIAMQQSILDESANIFASRFYMSLSNGETVDVALGEARLSMDTPRTTRENPKPHSLIDWGIPVLISSASDLNLFNLDAAAPKPAPPAPRGFSNVNLPNPGDIFVGRQKEQRQIARALRGGDARCIMILGPGGIGKSSLVARTVEQGEEYFHAVLTIGCKSAPSAELILHDEIDVFLNLNGNTDFSKVMANEKNDLSKKIGYLPQILNTSRYLIIFDNFEEMLDITKEPHVIKDENIINLLETLTLNLRDSRVMITSRQDFDFTRDKRYQANILQVSLRELTRMEAFRLMQNIPSLCNAADDEKVEIFQKVGGNPFILDLVAARARDVPVGNVLAEIKNVQKEFVEKTMLNNLYDWLPDDETRKFFRKSSIYRMPVNQDFLVAVGGNDDRIGYLLHKSLLNRISGDLYEMHSNTRAFGFEKLKEIDGSAGLKETQITAAKIYYYTGMESKNVEAFLEARKFYFEAGDFDEAGTIVNSLSESLIRWGYIELTRELLEETIDSTSGSLKSDSLHDLGNIHKSQGRYDEAIKLYYESMKINEELENRGGIARTLYELGVIHQDQGRYDEAIEFYQKSKKISEELKNRGGIAEVLHQLGNVNYLQDKYDDAIKLYQESMTIAKELKDISLISNTLGQMGNIRYSQGRYDEAVKLYQESMTIAKELGYKGVIARILHQLGLIHQEQDRYDEAIELYQESIKIKEELGDEGAKAITIGQMGKIFYSQKKYREALRHYLSALNTFKELKSPNESIVNNLIIELKEELGEELFYKYDQEIKSDEQRKKDSN